MTSVLEKGETRPENEFVSGEVVEPGLYVDVETGATVQVVAADELPEGSVTLRYRRHFRKIETARAA